MFTAQLFIVTNMWNDPNVQQLMNRYINVVGAYTEWIIQ